MAQITIKDIAKESGVGITTVSKVINNKAIDIKESTRNRVMDVIKKLNYHPSYLASSLRSGKRNCIGVAGAAHLSNINDPVISAIYAGIGGIVQNEGNLLTIIPQSTGGKETYENVLYKVIKSRMVDGIIMFVFPAHEEGFPKGIGPVLQDENIPFVPVVFTDVSLPGFYSVGYDTFAAGQMAAQHLVDQGETDIFAISYDGVMGRGFLTVISR